MAKLKLKLVETIIRWVLMISGAIFVVSVILSFTTLPFWAYYWLGTSEPGIQGKPDYIIFFGGGGMPSESNLMRAYYTFQVAQQVPESKIIISIPGDTTNARSAIRLAANELILKGIDKNRILFEPIGTNTRMEGLCIDKLVGNEKLDKSFLIVTSPEHMLRAFKVLKKIGFSRLYTSPAFEKDLEASLKFKDDELGGNNVFLPDIGDKISVRYQFWNHLKLEITIGREITALVYYKLRGWI